MFFTVENPSDFLLTFPIGKQPCRIVNLPLTAQVRDHSCENHRLAFLISLKDTAAAYPNILPFTVEHLILHIVNIGLTVQHLLNRFRIPFKIPGMDQIPPYGNESRHQPAFQLKVSLHIRGYQRDISLHVNDINIIIRASDKRAVKHACICANPGKKFIL